MSDQPKPGEKWGPYVANGNGWFKLKPTERRCGSCEAFESESLDRCRALCAAIGERVTKRTRACSLWEPKRP